MTTATGTAVLYQLDHLSARFHVLPYVDRVSDREHDLLGIDLPLPDWIALGRPSTLTLTINTTPASAEPDWAVGHEFTGDRTATCTSDSHPDGGGFSCVRPRDHVGKHLATSPRGTVLATWDS